MRGMSSARAPVRAVLRRRRRAARLPDLLERTRPRRIGTRPECPGRRRHSALGMDRRRRRDGVQLLMAVKVDIDVSLLKSEIKKTYASVSNEPERDFIFPTGRAWAEGLGYPDELANVPESAVESFAGVANPWDLGRLAPGERVLDLGSGAGTDSLVAAQMVGPEGLV